MLLSLTRLKMADVDVDGGASSMSAIALTAVVGAVVLLLVFLCNFVKKGFEKNRTDTQGTSLIVTQIVLHHVHARPQIRGPQCIALRTTYLRLRTTIVLTTPSRVCLLYTSPSPRD